MWGWRFRRWARWPSGWWCPRHPWPPPWARWWSYRPYTPSLSEEIRVLEEIKRDLEEELAEISKRIEELKKSIQEKR